MIQVPTFWTIPKMFGGMPVLIIGGGHSLENFDWTPFHSWSVIGCNDAYLLGDWVDVVISGDKHWLDHHEEEKEYKDFKGVKVNLEPAIKKSRSADIKKPRRILTKTDEKQDSIGWNDSTGAAAIDLARKMGASQIILLGYDMKLGYDKESETHRNNWHENNLDIPDPDVFARHTNGLERIRDYMEKICPKVEIINAGPDSDLELFPRYDIVGVTDKTIRFKAKS